MFFGIWPSVCESIWTAHSCAATVLQSAKDESASFRTFIARPPDPVCQALLSLHGSFAKKAYGTELADGSRERR